MSEQKEVPTKSKSSLIWKIIIMACLFFLVPFGWVVVLIWLSVLFLGKIKKEDIKLNDAGVENNGTNSTSSKNVYINELPEEDAPQISSDKIFPAEGGLDIPSCVTYFAQLKRKYSFPPNVWNPIRQRLIHIKRRNTDPLLYLGVIGEASAGKSTFINALLGIEFLKEDTSLGTTTAATIIKYSKKFEVRLNYSTDHPSKNIDTDSLHISDQKDIVKNSREILELIQKYTAEELSSANIYSVEISLPIENKFLQSGVAIVDTPGLNSGNLRHDEVTTRTIKEICDTALILVPANVPLSEKLGIYVRENLSDVLSRCVLVMTQADTLRREKERTMQLAYITKRLQSATGEQIAASFCSSAYYVLSREDYGKYDTEAVTSFRNEFMQMADKLYGILSAGRTTAVTQNILVFLKNDLLPILTNLLNSRKQDYTKRRKALDDNQLLDFNKFILQKNNQYQAKITATIITEQAIIEAIDLVKNDFYSTICRRIDNASERDGLKYAMNENYIRSKISELQGPLKDALAKVCSPLNNVTAEALRSFHQEFIEAYKRLQTFTEFSGTSNITNVSSQGMDIKISIGDFGDKIDTQLGADVMKTAGGAGAGAVIGSFICPGLGTVLGAAFGGLVGFFFRKSLDELKEEARATISSVADDWGNQMIIPSNTYIVQYRMACNHLLKERIEKYQVAYGEKINQLIAKEKAEQNKLYAFTQLTESDINLLEQVNPKAEAMISQLRTSSSQSKCD